MLFTVSYIFPLSIVFGIRDKVLIFFKNKCLFKQDGPSLESSSNYIILHIFNYRTNQWFNIKTICTFIASGMLFLVTLIQLLPVSYELHSLSMKHSKWVNEVSRKSDLNEIFLAGVSHSNARMGFWVVPSISFHKHAYDYIVTLGFQCSTHLSLYPEG